MPDVTPATPIPLSDIDRFIQKEKELQIERQVILNKSLTSNSVPDILKAQSYIKDLEKRDDVPIKSLLLDPLEMSSSLGYKDKPYTLSYQILRGMSRTHIVRSIIDTRKEQVAAFCSPQTNKYQSGFVITKKTKYGLQKKEVKLSKADEERIEDIIEFLLNCGNTSNFWHADDFSTFVGKIVDDSLTLDQATAECIRNKKGELIEFLATDAATYRVADSYEEDELQHKEVEIKGYTPSHVQIYQNRIVSEFYPWELMFGVRNPQTDIRHNGYGRSELEDMIQTVTAILNSDYYNANFFKVGSAPKGILKYSGNINQNTVEDFRRQWVAQVSGVANMHKIPLINADKLDFIPTGQNNKDMEFSKYQEFLIKITCAMYKIDPSEIGFPMSGSSEGKPMFEGNNEARLKYSKDKGLKPLLKKIERWINKWFIRQLDESYEFRFQGIERDENEKDDLDQDIQRLSNFMTVNEIRAKWNLDPIDGGDTILNPTFQQAQNQAMQGNQDANEAMQQQMGGGAGQQDQPANSAGGNTDNEDGDDNPFMKALIKDLPSILA